MNEPNAENNQDLSSQEEEVKLPPIEGMEEEPNTEKEEEPKGEEESQESQEDNSESENQKKKSNPFSKRLRKKNDRIAELEARLAKVEQPVTQEQNESDEKKDGAPDPKDFEHGINDIEYIKSTARWEGKQAYLEAKQTDIKEAEEQKIQKTVETVEQNFNDKMSEAWEKHSDFEEVWEKGGFSHENPAVMHAIKGSEIAGDLTYHILKDSELSAELSQMDPVSAIRKIGQMEAKLTSETNEKPKRKKTGMPDPFVPVGSGKTNSIPEFSEDMSPEAFAARFPIEF